MISIFICSVDFNVLLCVQTNIQHVPIINMYYVGVVPISRIDIIIQVIQSM